MRDLDTLNGNVQEVFQQARDLITLYEGKVSDHQDRTCVQFVLIFFLLKYYFAPRTWILEDFVVLHCLCLDLRWGPLHSWFGTSWALPLFFLEGLSRLGKCLSLCRARRFYSLFHYCPWNAAWSLIDYCTYV